MTHTSDGRRRFTVISAHFGDLFWIMELTKRVQDFSLAGVVPEVVPINQDRLSESREALLRLPRVKRVFEFAANPREFESLGHDHPSVLNQAVRGDFETSHLIVMDSDCLPLSSDWLSRVERLLDKFDAVVAGDPGKMGLSHPCFMAFPVSAGKFVDFSEGLHEVGLDTGRLVGFQLVRNGYATFFDRPSMAFRGRRGHLYFGGSLYHHHHASFISSSVDRVKVQVNARREAFFRQKVEAGKFDLYWYERILFRLFPTRTVILR